MEDSKKLVAWVVAAFLILGGFWMMAKVLEAKVSRRPAAAKRKTVQERVTQYGVAARARMAPGFKAAGVSYPPAEVALVGFKQERRLQVWARGAATDARFVEVAEYPVFAASGTLGPKLAEGDRQVPEGLYRIESLNPNSAYHLSLRVDYPNAEDTAQAKRDGRDTELLGGDIMIHGSSCSIGCLAMGDPVSEELFVLAADTGIKNIRVILSPVDFTNAKLPDGFAEKQPEWVRQRYTEIRAELARLKGR